METWTTKVEWLIPHTIEIDMWSSGTQNDVCKTVMELAMEMDFIVTSIMFMPRNHCVIEYKCTEENAKAISSTIMNKLTEYGIAEETFIQKKKAKSHLVSTLIDLLKITGAITSALAIMALTILLVVLIFSHSFWWCFATPYVVFLWSLFIISIYDDWWD